MKRILSAVLTAAVAGCGGGGGGGGNVRVDDPMGIESEIDAAFGDGPAYLSVTEGGYPVFVDRESLSARDQAATDAVRGGRVTLTRAGERGGLPHFGLRGSTTYADGTTLNLDGYGAWGEHQAFMVFGAAAEGITLFGAASGGMFSESNPVGEGTATWKGAMIGESGDKFLSGNSTIEYDFSAATVDVRMSGIRDWNTPQTYPDMVWNGLDVRNGAFTDVTTIRGSFYGPNHEEAGGVFDRGAITGAFGAKREED